MITLGLVFASPDNVDTDVILPARYLFAPNAQELALCCMDDIDNAFVKIVENGNVFRAGWKFSCGSSREPTRSSVIPAIRVA
jgi:3-isopropylmalate dehydratase small subunit